jgi:hypothetical protein
MQPRSTFSAAGAPRRCCGTRAQGRQTARSQTPAPSAMRSPRHLRASLARWTSLSRASAESAHARLHRATQSCACSQPARSRIVQSGHEMTREAGYRSPRQSGIVPPSLARTGRRPHGRPAPAFLPASARRRCPCRGRVEVPCVAPSPARITEPVLRDPFAQRNEVASGFRLLTGLCRPLGADAPLNAELRGDLAGSRLRAERKYVKRIHARDAGKAGRQFAR